jgi:hypothetical protein
METTDYFRNDVMVKRPYIKTEWLTLALSNPLRTETQADDGRVRHWV